MQALHSEWSDSCSQWSHHLPDQPLVAATTPSRKSVTALHGWLQLSQATASCSVACGFAVASSLQSMQSDLLQLKAVYTTSNLSAAWRALLAAQPGQCWKQQLQPSPQPQQGTGHNDLAVLNSVLQQLRSPYTIPAPAAALVADLVGDSRRQYCSTLIGNLLRGVSGSQPEVLGEPSPLSAACAASSIDSGHSSTDSTAAGSCWCPTAGCIGPPAHLEFLGAGGEGLVFLDRQQGQMYKICLWATALQRQPLQHQLLARLTGAPPTAATTGPVTAAGTGAIGGPCNHSGMAGSSSSSNNPRQQGASNKLCCFSPTFAVDSVLLWGPQWLIRYGPAPTAGERLCDLLLGSCCQHCAQ